VWEKAVHRAMEEEFSWDRAARSYRETYRRAMERRSEA
jgi:glycogen synthase